MKLNFTPLAVNELREIKAYISQYNEPAARRTIAKILKSISFLKDYPLMGREGRVAETRELPIAGTPYLVVYRLPDDTTVRILRVLHGARRYP